MDDETAKQFEALLAQLDAYPEKAAQVSNAVSTAVPQGIEDITRLSATITNVDDSNYSDILHRYDSLSGLTVDVLKDYEREKEVSAHMARERESVSRQDSDIKDEIQREKEKNKSTRECTLQLMKSNEEQVRRIDTREKSLNQKGSRFTRTIKAEMQFIDRVGVVVGAKVEVIRDRTIEVKFHSIDVKNRDAIYSLVIFAPDEETYDPIECIPHVQEFDGLKSELRHGKINIIKFVRLMREAFIKHAEAKVSRKR